MVNKNDQTVLDIIITVYNVEKYIEKCINSLVNQYNFKFRLIIVDDGSADKSSSICDGYSLKYDFIDVYHNKNQGLSFARYFGVSKSSGKYVTFVDGDDWVSDNYIERVFSYLDGSTDVLIFNYFRNYNKKNFDVIVFGKEELSLHFLNFEDNIFAQRLVGPELNSSFNVAHLDSLDSVCMKIYKRELIVDDCFVDTRKVGTGEDIIFNLVAFKRAKHFSYIPDCLYYYRKMSAGSITKTYRHDLLDKWGYLYHLILLNSPNNELFNKLIVNRKYVSLFSYGLYLFSSNISIQEKKNIYKKCITDGFYNDVAQLKLYKKIKFPYKLFYYSIYHRVWFMVFVLVRLGVFLKRIKR